jgi:DNA replication protein DnaC
MRNWETFDPARFVGRQQERRQCLDWLRQDQPRRLYSFVGAAGTGKTWLLQALVHDLMGSDLRADRFVPIFISFPQIADDMSNTPTRYATAVHGTLGRIMQDLSL